MLPRVRAVLLRLKFEGHPDLAEVDVRKMGNYWLKVTGDSLMLDGGIPAHMVNGQGRWRLHASDPPEMVYKYRQSDLETKLKLKGPPTCDPLPLRGARVSWPSPACQAG